jgi:hypothetical protein
MVVSGEIVDAGGDGPERLEPAQFVPRNIRLSEVDA